jgi:hypothetical protein
MILNCMDHTEGTEETEGLIARHVLPPFPPFPPCDAFFCRSMVMR